AWRGLNAPSTEPARPARTPEPAMLRLLVVEPGESDLPAGAVIEVSEGATFGRAERSSVLVADPAVSAERARVARFRGSWVIEDLGSTNGTLLNAALVDGQAELTPGDVVGLGTVRLKVVSR